MGERRFSQSLSDRAVAAVAVDDDSCSDHSQSEICEDEESRRDKDCQTLSQTVGRLGQALLLRAQSNASSHSPRDLNGPAVGVHNSAAHSPLDVNVADKTGHRRSRNSMSYQGTESNETADLVDDEGGKTDTRSTGHRRYINVRSFQGKSNGTVASDEGAANRRSAGQRRSINARSFQGKSNGTVASDEGAANRKSAGQRRSFQGKSNGTVASDEGATNTRSTGQQRSRNVRSFQGKSIRTVNFDGDEGAVNTRSTGQRRRSAGQIQSRNAMSFQDKSVRTVSFDGDEGAVNTRSTGQRRWSAGQNRSRNATSFQGRSSWTVDFDDDGGDEGPATFSDSFPLSRKEDQARNKNNKSFKVGNDRTNADLFAELFADLDDDGPTRHKENSRSFQGENSLINDDPGYDSNHHGSSFKQALAESRSNPRKQRSFDCASDVDDYCKPSITRSSSHKSFHAVESSGDDHDSRPSNNRRSPRDRPKLGRTMPPRGFKSHRRASIESTKSSSARATYLPRLELGDVGSNDDMIAENDHQAALELLDSLEKHSFCFTRRSNGTYTYSIVTEKDDRSMTVEVDETGSTKSCPRKDWPANFRLVNKDARLKKLDEKVLRSSTQTGVLSLFD